jgi:type VII secretion-associated serine protease mycosin
MLSSRMPTRRAAGWRLSLSCLLALTAASAIGAAGAAAPARADSVRDAQQWVLDAVNAPAAWPVSQGQGVLVAVIDSGVEPTVSDLAGSVTTGPDYSGVSTKPSDPNWGMHGTWMASLIAGHGHDGDNGISGVAPKATVLSIRVLPDKKDPAYAKYEREPSSRGQRALAKAIRYAVTHGAGVISMSLGYGASSRVVRAALQNALAHKVVVIASSGNSGDSASDQAQAQAPYSFPADYPGVLGVAAIDQAGDPANFSSDNLSVQVAAPGVQVPAQGRDGQYWLVSGTSPACALTSGVAALIKSAYPRLSPALIVRAITSTAQHRPPGGYDDRVGFGTVDAAAALHVAARLTSYSPGGLGLRPASRFGGGPAAIPPPPVRPRGLSQLVLFCLLAAGCLALTVGAASRLVLGRARWARQAPGPAGTAPGPPGPGPPPAAPPPGQGEVE